ncbi:MAG: endonuclease [Butyrivibrio sp.]|nr:endonuclease [Butyrivibrio sp.]
MKNFLKVVGVIVLIGVLIVGTVIGYLTIDEYNPQEVEAIAIEGNAQKSASLDSSIRIMSWNVGYGALGDNADFFMDGGKMVKSATKDRVYSNLTGIIKEIESVNPDILFTQEMDRNSTRSYFIDESEYLINNSSAAALSGQSAFAYNFRVSFVPLPVPPIGRVEAGVGLFSGYRLDSVVRRKLPCPFTWPLRTMNLKRCLEVARVPISNSDKELVLVNLHLEAYDDGEGKTAQTNMLKDILVEEYEKGNYVIAGGDFNQIFSGVDSSMYPPVGSASWQPAVIEESLFGDGFNFYMDTKVPSCRSLDRPLDTAVSKDPADFQYYIIDGFIVSKNIDVENVYTDDLGFVSSDHNPVIMDIRLE